MACFMSSSGIAVLLAAAAAVVVVSAQMSVPPCATKLAPCAGYLNSTSPPASCCNSIQDAVKNQLTCLCNLYNNPQLLKTFNVDPNQAFALSKNCGLMSDMDACNRNQAAAPGPTAGGPQGFSGGDSIASGLRSIGMSGFVGLFFFWASLT